MDINKKLTEELDVAQWQVGQHNPVHFALPQGSHGQPKR